MLFYLDSNQDKQDQNLLCCHYTIGQYYFLTAQNYVFFCLFPNKSEKNSTERLAF